MQSDRIIKDLGFSAVLGPFKNVVPIIGYAILYPVIIKNSGIEVLGLWSLLATIAQYLVLSDIGFSQILRCELGPDLDGAELLSIKKDYRSASLTYVILLCVIPLCLWILSTYTGALSSDIYPSSGILLSAVAIACAAIFTLKAQLQGAVLAAHAQNGFLQVLAALIPIPMFAGAIIGACLYHPLEGLAFGKLAASIVELVVKRRRIRFKCQSWHSLEAPLGKHEYLHHLRALMRRGRYFYLSSCVNGLREPIFRLVIANILGLEAAGIFDIAFRLTRTVFDLVYAGIALSLLSVFSQLHRRMEIKPLQQILQVSITFLIIAAFLTQGGVIALSTPFYRLWLGLADAQLTHITRIYAFWFIANLVYFPASVYLSATGYERVNALSKVLHTATTFLLFPLSLVIPINLTHAVLLWTGGGLFIIIAVWSKFTTEIKRKGIRIGGRAFFYQTLSGIIFLIFIYPSLQPIFSDSWIWNALGQIIWFSMAALLYLGWQRQNIRHQWKVWHLIIAH